MSTIYNNKQQVINSYIPQLGKAQQVSIQAVDQNKQIVYRSFKVYSFPNNKAKDIRLIELGAYNETYKASSYYQITQEFRVDTYSSTQEYDNNKQNLIPSFRTWEHTTTYLNSQRQLANRTKETVTWEPPIINPEDPIPPLLPPFYIQVGDVYGVTIPPNCTLLTNINPNLLTNVDRIKIQPLTPEPLSFSFRGVDVVSIELPYKIITDNPKLVYPSSIINPPLVPPNIEGLNTNFPTLEETELTNYAIRRSRPTVII